MVKTAVEARRRKSMARRACRLDAQFERILVAIDADLDDPQHVAGAFPLHPQAPARAGMEMGKAGLARFGDGLRIHVGKHQQRTGGVVDRDGGDEAIGIELRHEFGALLAAGGFSISVQGTQPFDPAWGLRNCCRITTADAKIHAACNILLPSRSLMHD